MKRAKTIATWTTPPLLALLLYWPGLMSWFQMDDFAWLNLRNLVHGWSDLRWALFAPLSQGTIRTLSERVFFMSFYSLFGMNSLPYHGLAFLTCAGNLVLIIAVCGRLSGSRAAGYWAAILWVVNSAIAVALSWTAIYYELLCAFFLLLTFWFLLRYVDTGLRRYYVAQCIVFVTGFLVLELNVVYPALAAVFALCCARRVLRKVLPLFAASAAYAAVHIAAAPLAAGGPYKMYWDASVFPTLWTYWEWALAPVRVLNAARSWWQLGLEACLMGGLLGFLGWMLWRRRWVAAFFSAWFVIALAPMLPLRDHITDYYLTVPLIGLAMWGGWALVSGWRAGFAGRTAALALPAIYLCFSVPVARQLTVSLYNGARETRRLVLGVAIPSRARPEKTVLLTGVSNGVFSTVVHHHPFRPFGIEEVYVASAGNSDIASDSRAEMPDLFIDPKEEKKLLDQDQAVVYDLGHGEVRDTTVEYRRSLASGASKETAALVDLGNPLVENQLGPTWYPNEGGFRWMPKRATVKLRGPNGPGAKLYLKGSCPGVVLKAGPLKMHVAIDGEMVGQAVRLPEGQFSFEFKLPPRITGRPVVEVSVELDRTFRASATDTRELGVVFGSFEIR